MLVLISVGLAILALVIWYWSFLHFNRRRAQSVLRWLEGAMVAHGRIGEIEWISSSHFKTRLELPGCGFRQPSLDTHFVPREALSRWIAWRWRRRQETLTFEADLPSPPQCSVEIGRTRWTGLTRRGVPITSNWPTHTLPALFISTQPEWDPEIAGRMSCVVSNRELEFLAVSFRPRTPHFSVTLSLEETLKRPSGELAIFDSLRELAAGSPTSRM